MISQRKEKILLAAVNEYIKTGEPVSSLLLAEKYNFGISPAMIRWELLDLEENGFLIHPYTSSGRVPTEKAYRFFVDHLLVNELKVNKMKNRLKAIENILSKLKEINEMLERCAEISKNHLLWFDENYGDVYESNLSETLGFFDFDSRTEILDFIKFIERVKETRENILSDIKEHGIAVFIGREFPYQEKKAQFNFSLLGIESFLPSFGRGAMIMLGPQRMNYENSLIILKKIKELTD